MTAVAFDAIGTTGINTTTNVSPATWTHTPVGTPTLIVVIAALGVIGGGDGTFTMSATYNSVSMTSLGTVHSGGVTSGWIQMWTLANPTSGAHSVSITCNTTGKVQTAQSITYTGTGLTQALAVGTVQTKTGAAVTAWSTTAITGTSANNRVVGGVTTGSGGVTVTTGSSRFNLTAATTSSAADSCTGADIASSKGGSITLGGAMTSDDFGSIAVEILAGKPSSPVCVPDGQDALTGNILGIGQAIGVS